MSEGEEGVVKEADKPMSFFVRVNVDIFVGLGNIVSAELDIFPLNGLLMGLAHIIDYDYGNLCSYMLLWPWLCLCLLF